MTRAEAHFERELLPALSSPDLVIFTNEVGEGYYARIRPLLDKELGPWPEAQRKVRDVLARNRVTYGLRVGSSDLVAVLAPLGRAVFLELKSPTGRLAPEQVTFLQRMRELGAVAEAVRTVPDALDVLRRARAGDL
jgi:hypothetical protein